MKNLLAAILTYLILGGVVAKAAVVATNIGVAGVSNGPNVSISVPSNIPNGSTILVFVSETVGGLSAGQFGTLSDSVGNTYTLNPSLGVPQNCATIASATYGKTCAFVASNITSLSAGATITYFKFSSASPAVLSALYVTGNGPYSGGSFAVPCGSGSGTSSSPTVTLLGNNHKGLLIGEVAWYGVQSFTQSGGFSNPPNYSNNGSYTSLEGGNESNTFSSSGVSYNPSLSGAVQWGGLICALQAQSSSFIFSPAVVP